MINKLLIVCFILVLGFLFVPETTGQSLVDTELKTLFIHADTTHHDHKAPLRESQNDIDVAVSTLFLFYKTFISSQDIPTCIFTPSCSEYAVEALRKKGPVTGWLSTFDRLSRCHGFTKPGHYPFNTQLNRFYDPVW